MTSPYSTPNTPGSNGHGFAWQPVYVRSVDLDRRIAVCTNQFGNDIQVRLDIMRAKGVIPITGEQWVIEKPFGQWMFGAIINGTTRGVEVSTVTDLPETITTINNTITTTSNATNTTVAANFLIRPTGSLEMSILHTPPSGAIFLQGQALNRSDYPHLWSWITANGMLAVGLFGPGNGSTTFGCPDWRGLIVRGASASANTGELVGQDSQSLSGSQLPSHVHGVSHSRTHTHGFTTDAGGGHAGHFPSGITNVSNGTGTVFGLAAWNASSTSVANHQHTGTTGDDGSYTHTVASAGSSSAVDMRQSSVGVNWMIWT